jgi:TRAP-type mannitol/chloroaromatic compound transport system substrate-binding protein
MDIKVFGVGEIVPLLEMIDGVGRGVLEMCFACGAFWAGRVGPVADAKFYNLMGSKTRTLPPGELYTALSTGVVSAVGWAGPFSMYGQLKLHEVTKYLLWPGIRMASLHYLVNLKKWEELPDDLKAILRDVCKSYVRGIRSIWV